jgi:hypothetical protein
MEISYDDQPVDLGSGYCMLDSPFLFRKMSGILLHLVPIHGAAWAWSVSGVGSLVVANPNGFRGIYPLGMTNIAIENGPFIVDFPIKN